MNYIGEIAALTTALCWSLTSIVFTAAGKRIGALQVNLYRLPSAIILLTLTYTLFSGSFSSPLEPMLWLLLSGIVGLALGDTFLFQAFVTIGSRLSMLLLSLAPPMTAVLAFIFLGERLNLLAISGIIITLAGVSWVVSERTPDPLGGHKRVSLKGILWGVLAALGQAVGLIFAKKGLIAEIHPLLATLIRMVGATLVLWPISLMSGRVKNPIRLFTRDTTALKLVFIGVIFGPFLGVTLSLVSVKYTDTGVAATLMSVVPVVMIPLVILIEKERPSWRAVLGACITVLGVAILFLR
ncbi:MAG: DMT family transporter [Calditrichia bacterium]